jgi:hypothetical protein
MSDDLPAVLFLCVHNAGAGPRAGPSPTQAARSRATR